MGTWCVCSAYGAAHSGKTEIYVVTDGQSADAHKVRRTPTTDLYTTHCYKDTRATAQDFECVKDITARGMA